MHTWRPAMTTIRLCSTSDTAVIEQGKFRCKATSLKKGGRETEGQSSWLRSDNVWTRRHTMRNSPIDVHIYLSKSLRCCLKNLEKTINSMHLRMWIHSICSRDTLLVRNLHEDLNNRLKYVFTHNTISPLWLQGTPKLWKKNNLTCKKKMVK